MDKKRLLTKKNTLIVFLLCVFGTSLLFFLRFPNALQYPNFFAEDGKVFVTNLLQDGFWSSLFTRFNGYFVMGMYVLYSIATFFSTTILGSIAYIPHLIALVSYVFLGFCASLPVLLLKKQLRLPFLIFLVLLLAFVPLPFRDNYVIGTLGQSKFLFGFIAYLLALFRFQIKEKSKWVYGVDAILLLCAYTNPVVYLLIPLFWIDALRNSFKSGIKTLLQPKWLSLIVLSLLLCLQVGIILTDGTGHVSTYLDGTFDIQKAIEVFIGRTFLFPLFLPIYSLLNDATAVALFIAFLWLFWRFGSREHMKVYVYSLYAAFVFTFLFVIGRPAVSKLFDGYSLVGPDQFFFVQNLIVLTAFTFLLQDIFSHIKKKEVKVLLCWGVVFYFILQLPLTGSFGQNRMMQDQGTFLENAKMACEQSTSNEISIQVYPDKNWSVTFPSERVCDEVVTSYEPQVVRLGLEAEENTGPLTHKKSIYQTFVSPQNKLRGIKLFLATYKKNSFEPYVFSILDETCTTEIRKVEITNLPFKDNMFHEIIFPTIEAAKDQTYCMHIVPREKVVDMPITIGITKQDEYSKGSLYYDKNTVGKDLVFEMLYE